LTSVPDEEIQSPPTTASINRNKIPESLRPSSGWSKPLGRGSDSPSSSLILSEPREPDPSCARASLPMASRKMSERVSSAWGYACTQPCKKLRSAKVRINHGPAHHNALGIHRHVGAAPDVLQLKTWTAGALACARENVAQAPGPPTRRFCALGWRLSCLCVYWSIKPHSPMTERRRRDTVVYTFSPRDLPS
jgi:hypothetical protein